MQIIPENNRLSVAKYEKNPTLAYIKTEIYPFCTFMPRASSGLLRVIPNEGLWFGYCLGWSRVDRVLGSTKPR